MIIGNIKQVWYKRYFQTKYQMFSFPKYCNCPSSYFYLESHIFRWKWSPGSGWMKRLLHPMWPPLKGSFFGQSGKLGLPGIGRTLHKNTLFTGISKIFISWNWLDPANCRKRYEYISKFKNNIHQHQVWQTFRSLWCWRICRSRYISIYRDVLLQKKGLGPKE